MILDTLEILVGHPSGEARRQSGRWVCAQRERSKLEIQIWELFAYRWEVTPWE